jgi:hypothetical protein
MWDMLAIRSRDDAAEVLASLETRVWECPTEVCLQSTNTDVVGEFHFKRTRLWK